MCRKLVVKNTTQYLAIYNTVCYSLVKGINWNGL